MGLNLKEKKDFKIYQKFMVEVSKLEIIEFLGLAKLLGVKFPPIKKEEDSGKEFEAILNEISEKFAKLSYKKKKAILKILVSANRDRLFKQKGVETNEISKDSN